MNDIDSNCNNKSMLNFHEILQLFNCAVSQEQAWAILYQVLKEYKHIIEHNLIFLHNKLIINNNCIGIRNIYFRKDGSVCLNLAFRNSTFKEIFHDALNGLFTFIDKFIDSF